MNIPAPTLPFSLFVKRFSISAFFFILGIVFATWASRIPSVKAQWHLSDGELGTLLLGMPVGSLLVLPLAGWLTARFGSRTILIIAGIMYSLTLPALALLPNTWTLGLSLMLFGAGGDLINIAANDQAVELEKRCGRSIMSSFHALFSVGGMVGAAVGGLMYQQNVSLLAHFAGIAAFTMLISVGFYRFLLATALHESKHTPLFVRPDRAILGLGVIGFCVMLGEGSMADWSSVYLTGLLPEGSPWTTAGYTAFSLAMAAGRFGGDWITNRLGSRRILIVSGLLSGSGLLLALLVQQPIVVIVGFACVGLGFATVVPLVYSAAGQSGVMSPGMAIAAVSTVSYLGFLAGPPLIGWLSEAFSLRWALLWVVALSFMISILARRKPVSMVSMENGE